MNYLKGTTVGIDSHIKRMQTNIYSKLKTIWGINNEKDFNLFGRAYRNQTEDGYTPEQYLGNGEYKDLYWDDALKAMAFFGVKEESSVNAGTITSDCHLIFMVNIKKLKSGNERQDEEIRNDVEKLCIAYQNEFTLIGVSTGVDTVFSEYSGWKRSTGMKYKDTYPFHCFRLNFKCIYSVYD